MTDMTDAELLRAAIDASGLSARQFAVRTLVRDERQIRRWLAGESDLPAPVRNRCLAIVEGFGKKDTS